MKKHSHLYDFGEYPKDHPCYDPTNLKVTGKFKDETLGRPITEVVAITSKMYPFKVAPLPSDVQKMNTVKKLVIVIFIK